MGASRRSVAPLVLHNLLAQRQEAGFSMIGKWFPMGGKNGTDFPMIGKIFRPFSNDWKTFFSGTNGPVFGLSSGFSEWDAAGRGLAGAEMEKKRIVCAGMGRGSEWEDWMCRRDRGKRRPGAHGRHCLTMDARGTALVPPPDGDAGSRLPGNRLLSIEWNRTLASKGVIGRNP